MAEINETILKNKLVLRVGIHNDIEYTEDELKKLLIIYQSIEAIPLENRTMEELHALELFKGSAEDHQDSTGTLVGYVEGAYWDEEYKAIAFKRFVFNEENFAKQVQAQLKRGKLSFGISPRIYVRREGNFAMDIIPKNLGVVLEPAGGEPLMLSRKASDKENYEYGRGLFEPMILKQDNNVNDGGYNRMEPKDIEHTILKVLSEKEVADKEANRVQDLESKVDNLTSTVSTLVEALKAQADEKKDEKKMSDEPKEEVKEEVAEEAKEEAKEEVADEPKEEVKEEVAEEAKVEAKEETEDSDELKKKYYGSADSQSVLSAIRVNPKLISLDGKSINRVAVDLFDATKVFDGKKAFTLEQAQKAVDEINSILTSLPCDEKEENEVLSKLAEMFKPEVKEEKLSEKKDLPKRKGLVRTKADSDLEEETLSEQEDAKEEKEEVKLSDSTATELGAILRNRLANGLGVK